MQKIKIIAVPPGFAPLGIRERWLDIEIPLATEEEIQSFGETYRFGSSADGYTVTTDAALKALEDAGKIEAYNFWNGIRKSTGVMLVFKKECCELLEQ